MKIEDVTKEALERAEDAELYGLRIRFVNFYKKHFEKGRRRSGVYSFGLRHGDVLSRYALVVHEIRKRNLNYTRSHEIDKAMVHKSLVGLDVRELRDVVVAEDFICIIGDFARNPQRADTVAVAVCKIKSQELEKQITPLVKKETEKNLAFYHEVEAMVETHIPLFDLVLRPKLEVVRKQIKAKKPKKKPEKDKKAAARAQQRPAADKTPDQQAAGLRARFEAHKKALRTTIEKPEETATQIRIPVGSPCEVTATIMIDATKGIRALYCGKEKRIRTYLFDKKKWTMAEAKAWVKEHKKKAAVDVHKELSAAQRKECDAETARIKANAERPIAAKPHQFKAAQFTHPNGHPRCLTCGCEQPIGDVCNMKAAWYDTCEWDDAEAWKKERAKLRSKGIIKDEWLFKIYKQVTAKQIVGGVVYEPEVVDTQGDITSAEEIREAMYSFMEKYNADTSRIKVQHAGNTYQFPILEVFQPEQDIKRGGKTVKKGSWWMMIKITNDAVWKDIVDGQLNAFSMGGTATAAKK